MSRRSTDWRLVLGIAMRRLRTSLRPELLFLSACNGDAQRLVSAFDDWCARHRGAVCDLALSGQWVRTVVAPAAAGVMSTDDLRRYAERQLAHYFGDSRATQVTEWKLAVSEDARWPLVLAVPRATMAALQQAAARHHVRIGRVAPWWLGACSAREPGSRIVHAREPEFATTIHITDGRLTRIAVDLDGSAEIPKTEGLRCEELELRLPRQDEALDAVCDAPEVIAPIAASLRRRPQPELDLLRSRIPPWRASWALLVLAAAVAAIAEHRRDKLLDEQADAQAALIRAQARPAHAVARGWPVRGGAGEAEAEQMQAALEMLALRDHPWADVFAGLDAVAAPVEMLELAHDAKRRSVDLTLLVPDDEAGWGFAQRLASDSSRFGEASLVSRERLDPPSGAWTSRVHVRAVLKDVGQGVVGGAS